MRHNAPSRALLEREAEIRAQLTTFADLAIKTGYSEQYIANFIGRLVRLKRQKVDVSQEHRRFSHTEAELDQFAADLRDR